MATFTIVLTDDPIKKGHVAIEVTSDPKMSVKEEPTPAQMFGLTLCDLGAAVTAAMGVKHEVVNADGSPIVTAPVQF